MKARSSGVVLSITLVLLGLCAGAGQAHAPAASRGAGTLAVLEEARMKASNGAADDAFGTSVAISGNTAVVGAPDKVVGGTHQVGVAYVFTRSASTWTEQTQLPAPSDAAANRHFGDVVALSGDTALVGRYLGGQGGGGYYAEAGVAYVYMGSGASWAQQEELAPDDGTVGDLFGAAVTSV